MVVVLPAPFGPSSAKISPRSMSRSIPATAVAPRYRLRSPRTRTAYCAAPLGAAARLLVPAWMLVRAWLVARAWPVVPAWPVGTAMSAMALIVLLTASAARRPVRQTAVIRLADTAIGNRVASPAGRGY